MTKTVYVVGELQSYISMFVKHNWTPVEHVEDADLVQFCGGPDVHPVLYGQKPNPRTTFDSERDVYERNIYELAVKHGVPCAGICRGAQFLHVMNGGSLYQHVDGHAISGYHKTTPVCSNTQLLWDYGGNFNVTSTHHQMMADDAGEVVLASWISSLKEDGDGIVTDPNAYAWDVEAVWHPMTRTFCYQPHPEYVGPNHDCQRFYFQALRQFIFYSETKEEKEAS